MHNLIPHQRDYAFDIIYPYFIVSSRYPQFFFTSYHSPTYTLHVKSITQIVESGLKETVAKSERAEIIKQIYSLYACAQEKKLRSIENWKRFNVWCRERSVPDSDINRKLFRRSHNFIKEMDIKSFCIFISMLSLNDLYYVKSVSFDKSNRGESVGAFIIGSCKKK